MKHTPTESRALARAKSITPMSAADRAALPADPAAWTPRQRRLCREERLRRAAEAFWGREMRSRLFRLAQAQDDRAGKRDYRVTSLDVSTARVRAELISTYREILELDGNPLFGYTPRVRFARYVA